MYTVPTSDLKNLKCEMTLFKGEIVFQAAASPVTVTDPEAASPNRRIGRGQRMNSGASEQH